ncbi:BMP family ABC transporter substrate-binding protein [Lachnoclostridium pacaense]|uniref:BMP family lipoprotein n=1 Tax=Enterocloster hominis (ex Hitch et al. 2024) TaxID=1917870 RepID=UPI001D11EF22|nr:BMP family ABC transporter substrate-binding protein [Lachnoclostridium pacaense]MCC2820247.1 BMP family ABC transporter substrate-binding protein [Lachnoclostridium pacaense]
MKKRIVSTVLAAAMAASMLAGCGSSAKETTAAPAGKETQAGDTTAQAQEENADDPGTSDKPLKVVYLCNGNLGDKGFNDSAASGMQLLADKMGAEVKTIEMGRDETSYEGNYLDVSEQDWDMIVSGTWSVKELAQDIAAEFPDKNYLIFDVSVDRDVVTEGNMMGVNYYSNQAAFLSGVLAAKMLDSGDAKIDPSKKILGFVGSMDTSNINDFLVGYLEGIQYVDPEIKVVTSYVGSFEDVSKCMEMTTQLYNQGAQVVYAPASQSILGAVTAAQKSDKYLIACDQDIYAELKDSDPELAANVISSSLKNVGESIYTSVKGWSEGTMSLDQDYILGLDSGAVGLAKNENYTKLVPEDIQKFIDETEQKVISGDITVGTAFDMTTEDVAALRDGMKP